MVFASLEANDVPRPLIEQHGDTLAFADDRADEREARLEALAKDYGFEIKLYPVPASEAPPRPAVAVAVRQ